MEPTSLELRLGWVSIFTSLFHDIKSTSKKIWREKMVALIIQYFLMESQYDHIPLRDIHRKNQYLFLFQHPAEQQRNLSIVPWEKKWIELRKHWENSTMRKYVTRRLIEFFKWMSSLIFRSQRVHKHRALPSPEFKKEIALNHHFWASYDKVVKYHHTCTISSQISSNMTLIDPNFYFQSKSCHQLNTEISTKFPY